MISDYLARHNISVAALIIEMLSIIFAVLLALGVNEWRQVRNNQNMVNAALAGIEGEIRQNQSFLQSRLPYYQLMTATIDSLFEAGYERDSSPQLSGIPGWRGLQPPLLQASAYQASISTQAFANMDFGTASRLSRLYAFQDLYYRLVDRLLTAALNGQINTLGKIRTAFNELYSLGSELAGNYQQTLESMGTQTSSNN